MRERLKLVESGREREVITQKELAELVQMRKDIWLLRERNARVIEQMVRGFINQWEFDLAIDERKLMEVLKRGAVIQPGKLTEAVLWKPSRSSRRLWRKHHAQPLGEATAEP